MKINKFEDLEVWQLARDLVKSIYSFTPNIKDFNFVNQIQKSAVFIMKKSKKIIFKDVQSSNLSILQFCNLSSCNLKSSNLPIPKDGYTLIEIIILFAIFTIVAASVFFKFNPDTITGQRAETLAQNITSAMQTAKSLAIANGQRYDVVLYSNQNDLSNPCPQMEQIPAKPETNDYAGNTVRCPNNTSYTCYWIRNHNTLEVYPKKEDLYKVDNDVCIYPYATGTGRAKIFAFSSDGSAKVYKYDETPISNPNSNNRINITGGYLLSEIRVTQVTGNIALTMCKQDIQFYPSSGTCGL